MARALNSRLNTTNERTALITTSWKDPAVLDFMRKFTTRYVNEIVLAIDEPEADLLERLDRVMNELPVAFKLIINNKRMGVGFGIRQALRYCQTKGYEYVVLMASNGKDCPSEIPRFTTALSEGFEYVQGSRFVRGGRAVRTPLTRRIFNPLWAYVWSLLLGIRLTEVTNGFRSYAIRILLDRRLHLDQRWLDGYALEYYIHFKALSCGYRYCEVPVTKTYPWSHKGGYSKIRVFRDWKDILLTPVLLRLGLRR